MSSLLLRPPIIRLDASRAHALSVNALYVPSGPRSMPNLAGDGVITTGAASAGKFTAGVGGYGAQFTEAANETFNVASDAVASQGYGERATFFGVLSAASLGANKPFAAIGSTDSRFEFRLALDSTNGFRGCWVDVGYAETEVQSIGSAPAVNTPIAFVYRLSGTSHGNVKSIHTSDGKSVTGSAVLSSYYFGFSTGRSPVTLGGGTSTGGFTGHIYQLGYAARLWADNEIQAYLANPWSMLRPPSLVRRFGAAFPVGGAPSITDDNYQSIARGVSRGVARGVA